MLGVIFVTGVIITILIIGLKSSGKKDSPIAIGRKEDSADSPLIYEFTEVTSSIYENDSSSGSDCGCDSNASDCGCDSGSSD